MFVTKLADLHASIKNYQTYSMLFGQQISFKYCMHGMPWRDYFPYCGPEKFHCLSNIQTFFNLMFWSQNCWRITWNVYSRALR